jgi:hypothetical protein
MAPDLVRVTGQPHTTGAWVAAAAAAWALLLAELATLAWRKAAIQASFCGLAAWLRTTFPLGDAVHAVMRVVHHQTNSFVYMQAAAVLALAGVGVSAQAGVELYVYVLLVHLAKNFGKSFIASPRGFWFCTEGRAISCGSGRCTRARAHPPGTRMPAPA